MALLPGAFTAFLHYRQPDLATSSVTARLLRADGSATDPQVLSETATCGGELAANEAGALIAVWSASCWDRDAGAVVQAADLQADGRFGAPSTLSAPGAFPTTAALSASGAAAVSWREEAGPATRYAVAVRDAPAGLAAATEAHVEALGDAVDPVIDVDPVPALTPGSGVVPVPVTCSETCDVDATARIPGAPSARASAGSRPVRLRPGRHGRLAVRLSSAQRRALRRSPRLRIRLTVRAEGYSRRRESRTATVRVRRTTDGRRRG
jgi:hypothetical protein